MTAAAATPTHGLPERLRLGTRDLHTAAECTGLMAALLGGRIDRRAYLHMLRNLHAIYVAMEPALARLAMDAAVAVDSSPSWAFFAEPALHRSASLADDLEHLHGSGWQVELPLADAAAGYADRLRQLADDAAPALAAHAYVRYLGDLHGGQVLRRRVSLALGLDGEHGLRFYDFGPPDTVQALRQRFREALGGLALAPAEIDHVVAEARWGFDQHIRLFDELASACLTVPG